MVGAVLTRMPAMAMSDAVMRSTYDEHEQIADDLLMS